MSDLTLAAVFFIISIVICEIVLRGTKLQTTLSEVLSNIRSHIESSILLRIFYLVRQQPRTANELMSQYQSQWGEKSRVDELVRAGLVDQGSNRSALTSKRKLILRIVDLLK